MIKLTSLFIIVILTAVTGCSSYESDSPNGEPEMEEITRDIESSTDRGDDETGTAEYDRVSVIENARLYKDPPEIKVPEGEWEKRYTEHPRWTFVSFVLTSNDGYTELVITSDGLRRLANKEEGLPAYRVEPSEGDSVEPSPEMDVPAGETEMTAFTLKRGEIVAVYPIEGPDGTVKVTDENGFVGFVKRDDLVPLGDERE